MDVKVPNILHNFFADHTVNFKKKYHTMNITISSFCVFLVIVVYREIDDQIGPDISVSFLSPDALLKNQINRKKLLFLQRKP